MSHINNPMEIFKLLNGSNCRECNEKICLAFAVAVFMVVPVLKYILNGSEKSPDGNWITFRELTGGSSIFTLNPTIQ